MLVESSCDDGVYIVVMVEYSCVGGVEHSRGDESS